MVATSSVTAVFEHPSAARDAEAALIDAGLDQSDVTLQAGESEEVLRKQRLASPNEIQRGLVPPDVGAAMGFTSGFLGGAFGGLLLGSGALGIMGREPAMAVGPFWSALIGAVVLGLAGALMGHLFNVPIPALDPVDEKAANRVRLTILSAGTASERVPEVVDVLQRFGPSTLQVWRHGETGWVPQAN